MVKYDSGEVIIDLLETVQREKSEPATFEDEEIGLRFELPGGWDFYKSPHPDKYALSVHLLSPELAIWTSFQTAHGFDDSDTARLVAEKDIELLKEYFNQYTVLPDHWVVEPIHGLDAATFQATYMANGQKMMEYRTYLLDGTSVHCLFFASKKKISAKKSPPWMVS